jgi:hypothetical protein
LLSFLRIRLPRFRPQILNALKAIRLPSICEGSGESRLFSSLDALVGLFRDIIGLLFAKFLENPSATLTQYLALLSRNQLCKTKMQKNKASLFTSHHICICIGLSTLLSPLSLSLARELTHTQTHIHKHKCSALSYTHRTRTVGWHELGYASARTHDRMSVCVCVCVCVL